MTNKEHKQLNINKIIRNKYFKISIFSLPLLFLGIFLYLYFRPLGFNRDYSFSLEQFLGLSGNYKVLDLTYFDFPDKDENPILLDGSTTLSFKPQIPISNLCSTVKITGKNVTVIPSKLPDISDVKWSINKNLTEEEKAKEYLPLETENEGSTISLNIMLTLDQNNPTTESYSEMIIKYRNLKIVQSNSAIKIIVAQYFEDNFIETIIFAEPKEESLVHNLLLTYQEPTSEQNGYILAYIDNELSGFKTVPSLNKNITEKHSYPWYEVVYDDYLIQDFSQNIISLGQERFTKYLLKSFSDKNIPVTNIYQTYSRLYEPDGYNYLEDIKVGLAFNELFAKYFEFEDGIFKQTFYPKEFYDNFKGKIHNIKVSYDSILPTSSEATICSNNTPLNINLWGERGEINNIEIHNYK